MKLLLVIVVVVGLLLLGVMAIRFISTHQPVGKEITLFFDQDFTVVAHRGGALEAPENTLEAFRHSAQLNSLIYFEFDVHLSKDGVPVVIHDDTVDRTTNCVGQVNKMTLEELRACDAGYSFQNDKGEFSFRGKGVKIPTLEEVISELNGRKLIIEIKVETPGVEDKIISIIKRFKAENRVIIASQFTRVIERFKRQEPDWFYGATRDEIMRGIMLISMWLEPVGTWAGHAYLIPEKDGMIQVLSDKLIEQCKRRNKKVLVWTVNDLDEMRRLKTFGVDGIISDRPSVAIALKTQ